MSWVLSGQFFMMLMMMLQRFYLFFLPTVFKSRIFFFFLLFNTLLSMSFSQSMNFSIVTGHWCFLFNYFLFNLHGCLYFDFILLKNHSCFILLHPIRFRLFLGCPTINFRFNFFVVDWLIVCDFNFFFLIGFGSFWDCWFWRYLPILFLSRMLG